MVLNIVQYGDPVLREKCKEVDVSDKSLKELSENMIETMEAANGIGIAAPQVGVAIQMAVVDVSFDPECVSFCKVNGQDTKLEDLVPLTFVNPKLELYGETETEEEGCLSIEEVRAKVKRRSCIKANLTLLDGSQIVVETDGLFARAIQHEVDHLNGILFTDRVSSTLKIRVRKKLKNIRSKG